MRLPILIQHKYRQDGTQPSNWQDSLLAKKH